MSLDPISHVTTPSASSRLAAGSREGRVAPDAPVSVATPAPNPRLRLDPALGMVVMEFRSGPGVPARSIPSAQELAAYRAAALSGAPRPGGS